MATDDQERSSNTAPKQQAPGVPFTKGDPRINRRGRPKNSDQLKALGLELLHEPAVDKNGQPIIINGKRVTNLEMLLRQWMASPRHQAELLERVFGKVPQAIEHTGGDGGPITVVSWDASDDSD